MPDIFARHRLNKVTEKEFRDRHSTRQSALVYTQILPTPTILNDKILVEMGLTREEGDISALRSGKNTSPICRNEELVVNSVPSAFTTG